MSNEDTGSVVDTVVTSTPTEKVTGARGVIGVASTSLQMKQRWALEGSGMSLKAFANKLVKAGDQLASDWFCHKNGVLNKDRSDKNKQTAKECFIASKLARKSSKK